ncbi:unnamed protein product [Timema podura]|uniref:Uncharacterized protein n=1 Tax=Timema podura TaxID=61482 RepID=A0ABN7NUN9_TIMPD|nr:unnamed protein product [Timema podura]
MDDSGMNEDLWGEDISEEAMEECLLQASQICSQTATNQQATNLVTIAASTSISQYDQFKMPILQTKNVYAFCKQSNSVPPRRFNNMVKKTPKNSFMKSELSQGSNPFEVVSEMAKCFQVSSESLKLSQEIHRLKEPTSCNSDLITHHRQASKLSSNNVKLDLKNVSSNLSNLSRNRQSESKRLAMVKQLAAQKRNIMHFNAKELNEQTNKFEERINSSRNGFNSKEVEISVLHTQLQDIEVNLKLQKVKKVKDDLEVEEPAKRFSPPETHDNVENKDIKTKLKIANSVLLGDLLGPHIFQKSPSEQPLIKLKNIQNFTEHKKRKQVNIEKLMADYERLNRVSLYLNRRSLEPCYASIHSLTVLDSLDCTRSKYHIEKIFGEVLVLLSDQLTMLKELDLSCQELQDLDRELLESSDERLMGESTLLSSEQWSSQESGVEARRGLGLLAAITSLSSHAASLLSGQAEYSSVITLSTPVKPNCQPFFVYDEFKVKPKELSLSYLNCNLGFLTLLCDLCVAIKQERRCLAYSGVLAGVVALIKSVMIHPTSKGKCMPLVCQILKEIVFCRPQVNVILPFTELLYILSPFPEVCGSLCHNSPKEKYLDKCSRDIIHFHTEDSCVLQVLSWLVGVRIANMTVRSHVCRNFVRWLSGCFSGPHHGPPWLHGMAGTCVCRKRLEQVTCGLLYRAFQDFKQLQTEGPTQTRQTKWLPGGDTGLIRELRSTIQAGILVLHRLVDQDQDFGIHIASMEGEWQMFVLGCGKAHTMLGLNARQRQCLEELVTMEEEEIKPDPGSLGMTPDGVRENETVFHHLWRDHLLYMSHNYIQ